MARQIEVRVEGGGRIRADFSGFLGDDCYDEAERLSKVLASLGLAVQVSVSEPKSPDRQRAEADLPEERTGRGGVGG